MLVFSQRSHKILASIGALLIVVIWSGWIILSRSGVRTNLTPEDLTMIRYGTASLFALPFTIRYNWRKLTIWKAVIVSLGCGFPYTMFSFYGLMTVKAASAGVIVNGLLPVFGVILSFLILGERTTRQRQLAAVLILTANVLMIGNAENIMSNWLGWLMLVGASLVFSSYMFFGKRWGFSSKDALAFLPLINAAIFLPWWYFSETGIYDTSFDELLLQASYQGVLVNIVAMFLTFYAVKHIGAMTLSVYFSFVPFVTAILAWNTLQELLTMNEIGGIIVCSLGLLLYALKRNER